MANLKKKKYIALLAIVVIVIGIIGLFAFGKIDKYKGKIKIKNVVSKTTSLSASISAVADNETQSKGTDIIKYEIGYTMDSVAGVDTRNVVINARINDEEGKYARFKDITGDNITSTLSNDGKEIEVNIENAPLGVENNITLRLNINNAPNGFKVRPQITVREATGDEKTVSVNEVEVVTNSVTGTVRDNNDLLVSNIELSLRDENGEIKRTYTDENGCYVFSDIENKTYTVNVEEEIYELVGNHTIVDGGNLNLEVKEVTPYELEAHKYITKLDLVINGKEEHYTYNDLEKVVQSVKNARTISGKIVYKISIKNIGEKAGRISKITDTVDEGLSFDKDKNLGWKEKDGKLYYEMAEGTVIKPKETKDITLILDIKNTNQIKTYINEADVHGETYERVVYILNGEKYREEDVILGEKLVEPVITDSSFSGWYTDKNFTNKYNFKNEVTKDLILYGKTDIIKHNVEFYDKNPETGVETKWDEKEVEDGKKVSRPENPSHTGYTFECWMDEQENIWNFNNPVERDLRLTSCYTINKYTVIFIDGNTEYNRQQVNYKGNINVPENPTKQYYTFEFWRLDGANSAYDLTTPVTENVTLYSKYQRNKHNISFVDKHPSTEEVVTREDVEVNEGEKVTPPVDPTKPGYDFKCWAKSNGTCYDFTKPVLEDEELTSKYTIIEYTITYTGLTDSEKESLHNPITYTVEDEITLNNPENRYDQDHDLSEIFVGWTGSNGNDPSVEVKITKGTTGDKTYKANWIDADPDVYPITYNLNNGHLDKDVSNPKSYTKKTDTFTLNNPSKDGYDFTGWSGTDLVGQNNLKVTIEKGSREARSYEAFYSPKNYRIDYDNTCGEVQNPEDYTIETPTFTLNNPSKDGYEFTGWKTEDDDTKVLNVTIPIGSMGNRKYIATCKPIEYNITYHLEGGNLKKGKTNPEKYTIESDPITLNNPSKDHYNFTGWTGTGLDSITDPVVIPTGSMGDREYTANYELITHNVTFNDYDVESSTPEETVTQFGEPATVTDGDQVSAPETNPTHTGYTCDKWSTKINGNYNSDAYDFSSKVTSDLTLYTLCKKNSYTVTYMDGDNQYAVGTVLYKEKATKPADDPTKNHHLFIGWTLNGTLFDFNTPITENITLYSSYEEVKAPEISHTPTEWTNQDVTVTVSKNSALDDSTGYTYKYRVEDGTYGDYVTPFSIGENCDVYAVAYKEGVSSEETKHEIRNIDKIKPTITNLSANQILKNEFTISITGYDRESGLREFRIYKDDEYVTTINYNGETENETTTYTLNNLEEGTVYNIKVVAVDVATNLSEAVDIDVETTKEEKIVAQITHNNGEELSEYIPLSSLHKGLTYNQDGIDCNTTQCTIQMLDNVTETNDVLEGQDITLDLNGFNVNGLTDYTINNNGSLKVIDTVELDIEEPKSMINYIKESKETNTSLRTDSTVDENLRYVGSNPNNYIQFNGELWRIIGVMNNTTSSDESDSVSKIKIVRANSIGTYSWDSSPRAVNYGYGVNEWSQADLMKLLNPGFENEAVGGSLYYNSSSGTCYRGNSNNAQACNFSTTGLKPSAKDMIDQTLWYTGSTGNVTSTTNYTPTNLYNYERGTRTGKICSSGSYCNDTEARTTKWSGMVGLVSPSDYAFATSDTSCTGYLSGWSNSCKNNDWLRTNRWSIMPAGNSTYSSYVYNINSNISNNNAYSTNDVYPTVYLKPDLLYKSGTGTSSDPFVLMTDAEYQNMIAANTNGIKNSTDVAIINNGIFTLGDKEGTENPVSESKPYIEGERFGVTNTGTFNFYDGKIKGTIAINGEVTDTPFPYNAIVSVVDEEGIQKQISVLKIVTDPEARINSVYYAKVQKAVDDANKGYYVDAFSEAEFFDSLQSDDDYGFYYDSDTDSYISNYYYRAGKSYLYMDFTDYEHDQELIIRAKKAGWDTGTITIRENDANGDIVYQNNLNTSNDDQIVRFVLEKGKRYYLEFYYSPYSSSSHRDRIYIKDIRIADYTQSDLEILDKSDLKTSYSNYTFEYDETDHVIKSNNKNIPSSNAFAYMELDLTTATEDKELIVNAIMHTYGNSSYGNVVVSEENNIWTSANSNGSMLYFSASGSSSSSSYNKVGPYNGSRKLEKGKKYYLQFYYFRGSATAQLPEDGLYINSIKLVPYIDDGNQKTSIIDQGITPGEYGFLSSNCSNASDGICASRTYNTNQYPHHTYFKVDLTNSSEDKILGYTINASRSTNIDFYGVVTDSEELPEKSEDAFLSYTYNENIQKKPTLKKGKINYVHFVVRQDGYYTRISELYLTSGTSLDFSKFVTPGNYGFYKYDSYNYQYYQPNNNGKGEYAHSYLKIDLTGDSTERYATVNLNAQNSLGIYATESTEMPIVDKNSEGFTKNNSDTFNGNAYIRLIPNKVNYLHFVSDDNASVSLYDAKIVKGRYYNLYNNLRTSGYTGFDSIDSYNQDAITPKTNAPSDSYLKIDLKDATSDKLLRVNAYDYYSDFYMYLSNNKNNIDYSNVVWPIREKMMIMKRYSNSEYYYINGDNTTNGFMDYDFVLTKGSTYYLHFGSCSSSSNYKLRLKNVFMYDLDSINMNTGSNNVNNPSDSSVTPTVPNTITEETDNSFRFIGKDPKNIVKFNNELWRIIGVFETEDENGNKDRRIKLIRNNPIGSYAWDVSENSTNGGYGVNEWSQADVMKLLNPGYENNKESIYESSSSSYKEVEASNSLYWNKGKGLCFVGAGNYVGSDVTNLSTDTNCDFTSIGLSDEAKQFIDTVKWGTTGYNQSPSSGTAYNLLNLERQPNANAFIPSSGADTIIRNEAWIGKVGLVYPSDVYLASGDYVGSYSTTPRAACVNSVGNSTCIQYSNWINSYKYLWTITPYWGSGTSSNPTSSVYMYSYGQYTQDSYPYPIRPTVYLSPKTVISSGSGTSVDPYELSLGQSKNDKTNYGLDEVSGESSAEDIAYDGDTVSFDDDLIKSSKIYSFSYNEEGDYFINDNKGKESSVATSYTTIDMTNETEDKTIYIEYDLSSKGYSDYGYINIMKDEYTQINYSNSYYETNVFNDSGNKSGFFEIKLEAGHMYYIQFGYVKRSSQEVTPEIRDEFKVRVLLKDENEFGTSFNRYDGLAPVLNQDVDTVHLLKNVTSSSTLNIVDNQDVILDLNGYTLTTTALAPVITNNGSLKIVDSKFDEDQYANINLQKQYDSEYEAAVAAQKEIKDQYSTNSYESDGLLFNYNADKNDDSKESIKNLVDNKEFKTHLTSYEKKTKGLAFKGSGYVILDEYNPDQLTVETTFKINTLASQFIIGNYESGGYGIYINSNYELVGGVSIDGAYQEIKMSGIETNKKYTVALTYDEQKVIMYVNGEKIGEIEVTGDDKSITKPTKNTHVSLGTNPVRDEPYNQYLNGVIYSARIYDNALDENKITSNYEVDSALLQDPIIRQIAPIDYANMGGTITSSVYDTILNNEGAYLEVDAGNINNVSSGKSSINNIGTIKVNQNVKINSNVIGITNKGIILPSTGSINASRGISNSSETEVDGFNITSTDYGIIGSKATVEDVNVHATSGYAISVSGSTVNNSNLVGEVSISYSSINSSTINGKTTIHEEAHLNNCDLTTSKVVVDTYNSRIPVQINNSFNSSELTVDRGTAIINNSHLSGSLIIDKDSSYETNAVLNDSKIASIVTHKGNSLTVNSSTTGIIYSYGNLDIKNKSEVVAVNVYTGTLNIGEDDETVSRTYPQISSGVTKVEYSKTAPIFNFYDGVISGNKGSSLNMPVSDSPENYDLDVTFNNLRESITLKPFDSTLESDYVAQIGSTKYVTLKQAVEAVNDNGTLEEITVLKPIYSLTKVDVPETKNIKINLDNNYIYAYSCDYYFNNNGTFTLYNSSALVTDNKNFSTNFIINNGTMSSEHFDINKNKQPLIGPIIVNNGEYNYISGDIILRNSNSSNQYYGYEEYGSLIKNNENAEFNISGLNANTTKVLFENEGTITYNSTISSVLSFGLFANNLETGTLNINGNNTRFEGNTFIFNTGTANINNVNNASDNISIIGYNAGKMNITNSKFKALDSSVLYYNNSPTNSYTSAKAEEHSMNCLLEHYIKKVYSIGTLNSLLLNVGELKTDSSEIYGNKVSSIYSTLLISKEDSKLELENTIFDVKSTASVPLLSTTGNTDLTITSSSFTKRPVQITGNTQATINDITIASADFTISETAKVDLLDGTIDNTGKTNGILVSDTSTLNLGKKGDGVVSTTKPLVKATTNAINVGTGTFNFYDGYVASSKSIFGTVNEVEDGYTIKEVSHELGEASYLDVTNVIYNVTQDKSYSNIQLAFSEANSGDFLQMTDNATVLKTAETILITPDKELTLNLNGYNISINNKFITNNGIFNIQNQCLPADSPRCIDNTYDNGGGGMIYSYIDNFIENNNTLNITGGGFTNKSGEDMFNNRGTMTIDIGGYFNLISGTSMINNNTSDASLSITGHGTTSNITFINSSASDMIRNLDGAELTITGGLFDAEAGSVIQNNDSIVNISDGEFTTNSVRFKNRTTSSISDASGYMTKELIINEGNSEMTITGGQFTNYLNYGVNISRGYNSISHYISYNDKSTNMGTVYAQKRLIGNKDSAILDVSNAVFRGPNTPALENSSTATISNSTMDITGYNAVALINNQNGNLIVDDGSCTSTYVITNKGTATIQNISSAINDIGFNTSGTLNIKSIASAKKLFNAATSNITDSELLNMFGYVDSNTNLTRSTVTRYIEMIHASNLDLVSSTVTNSGDVSYKNAIDFYSNGNLNVSNSSITSTTGIGINLEDGLGGIITIGTKDNNPRNNDLLIKGSTYGIYLGESQGSKLEEQVNFYDGTIEGEIPIRVPIYDIEDNYIITTDDHDTYKSAYLSQINIAVNENTNVGYNNLNQAFSEAANGNTIKLISDYYMTHESQPSTISSSKNIVFDLNGHDIFMARNNDGFVNNGTLLLKNTSDSGSIYGINKKYSLLENNGTLSIDSVIFKDLIINNKSNMTMDNANFDNSIINNDTSSNGLVINSGTYNKLTVNSINASSTTINNGTFSEFVINNSNTSSLNIVDGVFTKINLTNSDTSSTVIDGGTFGNSDSPTVHLKNNEGSTLIINDATINTKVGSSDREDEGYFYQAPAVLNYGSLTINDGTFNYTTSSNGDSSYAGPFVINAIRGTATIKDAKFNDGETSQFAGIINNMGTATIENVKTNNFFIAYNSGNITIKGITMSRDINNIFTTTNIFYNRRDGEMTIENCNITYTGTPSNGNRIIPMLENNGGIVILKDTELSGYAKTSLVSVDRSDDGRPRQISMSILGNSKINATNGIGLDYVYGDSLTIGEKGNGVSVTYPEISGETYGLKIDNASINTYYYDGIIKGQIPLQARVTEVEPGYDIVSGEEDGVNYVRLQLSSDIERVAVVNNINYNSLQAAVNACSSDGTTSEITIYTNITLSEALNVSDGKVIKVNLNGYNITPQDYVTNHTGNGSIEIVSGTPGGVGGAIYRFFANITGTEINPKDIVIYQMDNGEELSPATTYKLYKLMDGEYKVVRVKENEIGDYSLGAEKEILRTTTGQINIKGIGEGTYKLVGSDSKELTFDINENSVSSNIRVDRYSSKAKQTIHVVATLILTLQTGVIRQPFVVVISILLLTTIGFITYKKYRKEDLK